MPDPQEARSAARDRADDGAQRLAEGEQAARGAAEPTRENLARTTVGSSPDAGSSAVTGVLELVLTRDDGFALLAALEAVKQVHPLTNDQAILETRIRVLLREAARGC